MQVITETIRLANPVALLWREAKEDVRLNGNASIHNWKVLSMLACRDQ
jgi:cytochrome P450